MSGSHVAMRIGHVNESITQCIILEIPDTLSQ